MTTVTLLTAHPMQDSFNNALADAWQRGAERGGARVLRFDVSTLQFDPVLRLGHSASQPDEPDLAKVRAAFEASSHVTWVFPTWWAGLPAVLKGLVDRLLLPRWSFRYDPGQLMPIGLLAGRSTRYVTTMDSPSLWYRIAHHDALAGSFGRGTLSFVGFKPIERTLLFDVRTMKAEKRAKWLQRLELEGERDAVRARRLPTGVGVRDTA